MFLCRLRLHCLFYVFVLSVLFEENLDLNILPEMTHTFPLMTSLNLSSRRLLTFSKTVFDLQTFQNAGMPEMI